MNDIKTNNVWLMKGDCLERMKEIPSGSVDLILTDPPYGTTQCKWDSIIPLEPMWEQLKRIIKPNGAIVLFGTEPFSSHMRVSNLKQYKYDWVWDKIRASNFFAAKFQPLNNTENILVFSNGGSNNGSKTPCIYYPQGITYVNIASKNSKSVGGMVGDAHKTSIERGGEYIQTTKGYPTKILRFIRDQNNLHPTQKPVALMEYLIRTYTNETETVLDFTFGSGTTGVACVNTNRKFIGIEMDDKYFDIGSKRILEANKNE